MNHMKHALSRLLGCVISERAGAVAPTAEAMEQAQAALDLPQNNLEPKEFQQRLCQHLKSRADAQHLPIEGGVKRKRAYIEGAAGACAALEITGSEHFSSTLRLFILLCARGDVENVDAVAEGRRELL